MFTKEPPAIWHIYSDGTRSDIPFGREQDKCYVWNSIAICAWQSDVTLLVVTVNDTHFHLLCEGTAHAVSYFQDRLRQRLHRNLRKQGKNETIFLSCDKVEERTAILAKFMYVYRNCLDFYNKLPGEYPWGCGNIYFSEKKRFYKGTELSDLSYREYREYFMTHKKLPDEWRCDAIGRILPECFIDYESVERLFGSVRAFIAFLYVRKEDESALRQEVNKTYMEQRNIMDLRRIGNELSLSRHSRQLAHTSLAERLYIASQMIRQGISGKNASLAKALYLLPEDLKHLL